MPGFFVFAGERLRLLREERDQSREQLAVASSLSVAAITALELGYRNPSRAALLRLAAALGVSPRELVGVDPMFEAVSP